MWTDVPVGGCNFRTIGNFGKARANICRRTTTQESEPAGMAFLGRIPNVELHTLPDVYVLFNGYVL